MHVVAIIPEAPPYTKGWTVAHIEEFELFDIRG